MVKHLKPLFIKATTKGMVFNQVFVDGGVVLNVMPILALKKLDKNMEDFIPTKMEMANFMGVASKMGVTFFVINGKPSYSIILGRDLIHNSECVPSTLDQRLMFWVGDKVEIVAVDKNLSSTEVTMFEDLFYSPHLTPVMAPQECEDGALEVCNLTHEGFH